MPKIGVLFDIDELESGLYGYAAYQIFFEAIDTRQLAGCMLSDGDTNATLAGRANQYCIAVESMDASKIAAVKNALSRSNEKGLLPLSARFVEDARVDLEPRVQSTDIGSTGEPANSQPGWVMAAWKKIQEKRG
jgi:hypothetical protein